MRYKNESSGTPGNRTAAVLAIMSVMQAIVLRSAVEQDKSVAVAKRGRPLTTGTGASSDHGRVCAVGTPPIFANYSAVQKSFLTLCSCLCIHCACAFVRILEKMHLPSLHGAVDAEKLDAQAPALRDAFKHAAPNRGAARRSCR